jgi:Tfp pilus assembly major pilin PilA
MAGANSSDAVGAVTGLGILALWQLYHAYFISSRKMATPGKRLCGLYVTDVEGHRIGFGHALGRNLAAFFSYITLYIGFIMIAFSDRKQALHDKMAGTLVHRQPGSSSGVVVAIVLVVFAVVGGIGILAAIAIPQFEEYTVRARVHGVYYPLHANKVPIAEYTMDKGAWPTTWEQAGATDPMSQLNPEMKRLVKDIRLERDGVMVAVFEIQGKPGELRLVPSMTGNTISWTCSSTPEIRRFMPLDCRTK